MATRAAYDPEGNLIVVPPPTSPIKLMMVTDGLKKGNNKFYNMFPDGATFKVEYARVGNAPQIETYNISQWDKKYVEKRKKGYKDITSLVKVSTKKSEHKKIDDPKVEKVITQLMGYSKASVAENYTVSSEAVTKAQVDEAQGIVDDLTELVTKHSSKDTINKHFMKLYTVIPRKMNNVKLHLVQNPLDTNDGLDEARKLVDHEQATLDVMSGQVQMHVQDVNDDTPEHTILDILGIKVVAGNANDEKIVRSHMQNDGHELKYVFRVEHVSSRRSYEQFVTSASNKKQDLFWHGSRNENWISILQTGLKIRPSNAILTGAMFGHGIYFADKYRKSAGYTSLHGSYWVRGGANSAFLAMMDVHIGKQYVVTSAQSHLNKKVITQLGYDSTFAKAGHSLINNEYITYDDAQSTIKYLVQVGK